MTANDENGVSEARSYADQVLSKARSDATNRINTAESDRTRVVQDITSFAKTFNQVLPRYQSNPDLFIQQRLVEKMAIVFTNAQDKMFLPTSANGEPVELRLLLNREPPKPKTAETR